MVRYFKMEPCDTKARRYALVNEFCGLENNSLVPCLECAFTAVPKMLTGKKFPMNVCMLRFIVKELLRET